MSGWPSKDPDDYLDRRTLVPSSREGHVPQPPYGLQQGVGVASGLLFVLATYAVPGPFEWHRAIWLFLFGSWVGRSNVIRWWQCAHDVRAVSWVPASALTAVIVLTGFVVAIAAEPASGADRAITVSFSLMAAWFVADALDWALRKVHARRLAAASH